MGNYHEPLPYPLKRHEQWKNSIWRVFPEWMWWMFRNPFHNFTHFTLGITPEGERYEWIDPEADGWVRNLIKSKGEEGDTFRTEIYEWTKPGEKPKKQVKFWIGPFNGYWGVMSRGNWGLAFRK